MVAVFRFEWSEVKRKVERVNVFAAITYVFADVIDQLAADVVMQFKHKQTVFFRYFLNFRFLKQKKV